MLDALGQILPMAIVVALSPMPIIAVVLMLVSTRGRVIRSHRGRRFGRPGHPAGVTLPDWSVIHARPMSERRRS